MNRQLMYKCRNPFALFLAGCLSVTVVAYTFSFQTYILLTYAVAVVVNFIAGSIIRHLYANHVLITGTNILLYFVPNLAFSVLLCYTDYVAGNVYVIPYNVPTILILSVLSFLSAVLIQYQQKRFQIGVLFLLLSFFFSLFMGVYFVPNDQYAKSKSVATSKINITAYLINVKGDSVRADSLMSKVKFLEFSFIGCSACEKKREYVEDLYSAYKNDKRVSFLVIYDGKIDTKEDFLHYALKTKYPEMYYFDTKGSLKSKLNIIGYPTEIILNQANDQVYSLTGFNKDIGQIYDSKTREFLMKIL